MREIKLKIEGMHCAGCSNRLEKVLNNVDGVESAKVSLEEKSADIKYNEEEVELNAILQEIEDAGFKGEYVLVDVFAYNENAINFYNKKGYHPRMYTDIKKL